ncbi:MAG: serine hydrolase [Patescibacteria group bacterium]
MTRTRRMKKIGTTLFFAIFLLLETAPAHAMAPELLEIYNARPDLQLAFEATGRAVPGTAAGFLIDLEDWARQYGWRAYPSLSAYRPEILPPMHNGVEAPSMDVAAFVVIDNQSGQVLGAWHADMAWPMASITKLVTADIVSRSASSLDMWHNVYDVDDVGGAKLWVEHGTNFRVRDLLYAALVGSANNAANAVARVVGGTKADFVAYMNTRAYQLGLRHTEFADPSGIEVGNVSTAREIGKMAMEIFRENATVREMTQTHRRFIEGTDGKQRDIMTTNWMLYRPEYDDVWVTAGKTGYLHESGWNVVESMRSSRYDDERELVVVVLGSETRGDSFENAKILADWAWENFSW